MTAIATAVGAVGLLGAIGAAIFAGQQVREARKSTQAQMAAEFFRRWNDDAPWWRRAGSSSASPPGRI